MAWLAQDRCLPAVREMWGEQPWWDGGWGSPGQGGRGCPVATDRGVPIVGSPVFGSHRGT